VKLLKTVALAAIGIAMILPAAQPVEAGGRHAPLGYQLMCLKHPDECRGGGKQEIRLDAEVLAQIKRVNSAVNRAITPRNDAGGDNWNPNATVGDCEDYVLAKRRKLIEAGLPASALRIAYVITRKGEEHAVLVVNTEAGGLVLDNLTGGIREFGETGYRLVSMQGANPDQWS
jgi:predicted transglutaminase-like cysteine proteinase